MEFKFNEAPVLTPSMRTAFSELKLKHLWVVYPGTEAYPVEKGITTLPLVYVDTLREQFA